MFRAESAGRAGGEMDRHVLAIATWSQTPRTRHRGRLRGNRLGCERLRYSSSGLAQRLPLGAAEGC
mgnify:FL=1